MIRLKELFAVVATGVIIFSGSQLWAQGIERYMEPGDEVDGASLTFRAGDIDHLSEYLNDSKVRLRRGVNTISLMPLEEQEFEFRELIDNVIAGSGNLQTETLMRQVLRRARQVHNVLNDAPRGPKRDAAARRLLKDAVKWALSLHQIDYSIYSDFQELRDKNEFVRPVEWAFLGMDWAMYLSDFNHALPTSEARQNVMHFALLHLWNDFRRDVIYAKPLGTPLGMLRDLIVEVEARVDRIRYPFERLELARNIRFELDQIIDISVHQIGELNRSPEFKRDLVNHYQSPTNLTGVNVNWVSELGIVRD